MLHRRTVREVGSLAISITFVAALAVLAVVWHLPKQSDLESLEIIPNVLSMESDRNIDRIARHHPFLSNSRSKETSPSNSVLLFLIYLIFLLFLLLQYQKIFSSLSTERGLPAILSEEEPQEGVEPDAAPTAVEEAEPPGVTADADAPASEPANVDSAIDTESDPAVADQAQTATADSASSNVEEPLPPNGGSEPQSDATVAEEVPPKVDPVEIPAWADDSVQDDAPLPAAAAAQPSGEIDSDTDEWNEDWTEEEARCRAAAHGHTFFPGRLSSLAFYPLNPPFFFP
jgi:hypothetical protein